MIMQRWFTAAISSLKNITVLPSDKPMMMKKQRGPARIFVYMLAGAVLFALLLIGCQNKKEEPVERPAISGVEIEPVAVSTIDDVYDVTGTVRSSVTSLVASRVMGTVISLPVREGDAVRKGQLLLTIDDRDAVQRLHAANMSVEAAKQSQVLAETTWQRYKSFMRKRSFPARRWIALIRKRRWRMPTIIASRQWRTRRQPICRLPKLRRLLPAESPKDISKPAAWPFPECRFWLLKAEAALILKRPLMPVWARRLKRGCRWKPRWIPSPVP